MVTFWGKTLKDGKTLRSETFGSKKEDMESALLEAVEYFAKEFDMEAPLWHSLHTKQLGMFRKAVFKPGDFIDRVPFDRFELQILDTK